MAEFVDKDLGQGTVDVDQYNRHCHFVAGLVGEGLSRLFAASGLEKASLASELFLSDQMGLFLQKTNIIRDYLEDYVENRAFWPQTIWKKYSKTNELGFFKNQQDAEVRNLSLACLPELVTDALELAPDCLLYLSKLRCLEVFRFCAIPQVMAIATLSYCYSNIDVFTGVVKIRKGTSCKLILQTNCLDEVHDVFYQFSKDVLNKANANRAKGFEDPSYDKTIKICTAIMDITADGHQRQLKARNLPLAVGMILPAIGLAASSLFNIQFSRGASNLRQNLVLLGISGYAFGQYIFTKSSSNLMDSKNLESHINRK
jgi:farnesyl-diphosphate farnesyltransferase